MKKIIKIFVALCLGILMTFGIAGCNSAENNDEILKRLDALQTELQTQNGKINSLQTELQTQNGKINELQTNNSQLTEKLKEMQTMLEKQQKEINELILATPEDALADAKILCDYYEPTIDEEFDGGVLYVILKSSYKNLPEIGFEDFEIAEQVTEITSISYKTQLIRRGEGVKITLENERNQGVYLNLATTDKEKALEVIALLKKLDMVLVARPTYTCDDI